MKLIDKVKNPTNYHFHYYETKEYCRLMTRAIIKIEHFTGVGVSECHPHDTKFCSPKVGEHIAFIRAQIDILDEIIKEKRQQLYGIKDMMGCLETVIPHFELDPTNKILEYVVRRERELENFTNYRTQLKKELNSYLHSLDKNHRIIERFRENKGKTE